MSDFLFGIGRYFLVGFGVLGAIFAYLYFCGLVFKFWPRVGLALAAVVFAGVAALLCGVSVTAFLGPRIGMIAVSYTHLDVYKRQGGCDLREGR